MPRIKLKKLLATTVIFIFLFLAAARFWQNKYQPSSVVNELSADRNIEPSEINDDNPTIADRNYAVEFEKFMQALKQKNTSQGHLVNTSKDKQGGKPFWDRKQKQSTVKSTTEQQKILDQKTFSTEMVTRPRSTLENQASATLNATPYITSNKTATLANTYSQGSPGKSTKSSSGSIDPSLDIWLKQIEKSKKPPNILFIIADDMRPDIGFYNKYFSQTGSTWLNQKMHTPFLDGLAAQSLVFSRAYSQLAWCNPSRSSFLTSRRPDTTMVHNNTVYFRENNPNFVTLPQFFKNKGYFTAAFGKVFHGVMSHPSNDDAYSWSQPTRSHKGEVYPEPPGIMAVSEKDMEEFQLIDQVVTTEVMEFLDDLTLQTSPAPFFVAMGMKKPHLPFVFPERFLEKYPLSNITMPPNPTAAKNMPPVAWFTSFEFRDLQYLKQYADVWTSENALPNHVIKTIRQGYYACISYIDELIGKVLTKLKSNGFGNNTIVVFIGDHGYHLGEQSIMGKNTAFEVAANAPMMIRIPGVTDKGIRTEKLAEFVDIFPTLVELAGFRKLSTCPEANSRSIDLCTEGSSLVPLFRTTMPANLKWKESVFYQYRHRSPEAWKICIGYTIRTAQYRFTEWTQYFRKANGNPVRTRILCGVELYDHLKDPNETINIADSPGYSSTVSQLSAKLRQGWARAIPSSTE